MAIWIDASTDEYWQYLNPYTSEYSSYGYLGGGHWAFEVDGIGTLDESPTSPVSPVYGDVVTVSGIRVYYSFTKIEPYDTPTNFQFETNYARVSPLVPYGLASGETFQEWTFDPDIDERITKIIVPCGFSDDYASTAIITKIELRTSLSPDSVWKDYRNARESYIE